MKTLTDRRRLRGARTALLLLAALAAGPGAAETVLRLVDVIDASEADHDVHVLVQLACSAHYVGHAPAESGDTVTVRLRLGPDCGQPAGGRWPAERPLVTGTSQLVKSARLEETMPGEIAITLVLARPLRFVLAPAADGRGVRLRLADAVPGRRARVGVSELAAPTAGYSVNLESSREPFPPEEIATSAVALGMPTYVSAVSVQGTPWYRLRAGPITLRRDAERALALARQHYPRAWLGINDEDQPAPAEAAVLPPTAGPTAPVDPPLPDAVRSSLLETARAALAARDYPQAVELLTKLTRQPEYPGRARAQEMLGLARERAGQLAHARAEYQEYLRRYPDGEAAPRVRERLRSLAAAARQALGSTRAGGGGDEDPWLLASGASQIYRWEHMTLHAPDVALDRQSQNALLTHGDFQARFRSERYGMLGRVSASHSWDLLQDGPGDQVRVSSAFVELSDRQLGIAGRLGRQSRNSGGLLGTFDGLHASWNAGRWFSVATAFGFPVESTRETPASNRRFVGLAAEFGPPEGSWDIGTFAVAQQYSGETDRRAVGVEARYFVPGRTLVGMLDYDTAYHALNSAIVMGSLQLPARWTLGFNLDHRQSPVLTTRNALIGQPVRTLDELLGLYSIAEIRQLAEDRTPVTDVYSLSLSRPLGENLQFSIDGLASRTAATPASGGVAGTPEGALDRTLQLQLTGHGLLQPNDLLVLSARHQRSAAQQLESLGLWTRLPLGSAWRLGPRLRVDRRETDSDLGRETLYLPSLRIDYERGGTWLEFECGAELARRRIPTESERSRRYFFSFGYHIAF
jgi:tetratricopeptide (TPR) repeat protein